MGLSGPPWPGVPTELWEARPAALRDDARLRKLVAALRDKSSEQGSEQVESGKMLQKTCIFPYLNDFCNTEAWKKPPSPGYGEVFNKGYEEARKQLEAKAGRKGAH